MWFKIMGIFRRSCKKKNHGLSPESITCLDALNASEDTVFNMEIFRCMNRVGTYFFDWQDHPISGVAKILIQGDLIKAERYLINWYENNSFSNWHENFKISFENNILSKNRMVIFPKSKYRLPWEPLEKNSRLANELLYGPNDRSLCRQEVLRVSRLMKSIKRHGFSFDLQSNIIRGYLLLNENADYRFVVKGGQHRVAVLAALEYSMVPVTWEPGWIRVIKKNEAEAWPHVKKGDLSKGLASAVFDFFFREKPLAEKPLEK